MLLAARPTVIGCLINSSYFFYAIFFGFKYFFAVGRYCVTFIVVVGTSVFVIKVINWVKYSL